MERLSRQDYSHVLDLVVSVLRDSSATPPWQLVVEELARSLRGTAGVLAEVDWAAGAGTVHACTPASLVASHLEAVLADQIRNNDPLARHYATTANRTPMAITDLVEEHVWRQSEAYALARDTFGSTRHFAIPLASEPGCCRSFVIHRDGPDFNHRERAYATRMQPLLNSMDTHFRHLRRWQAFASEYEQRQADGAARDLRLTPRELTVLVQLSEALTADSIGRKLGISTRTVHKHLESLYRKLDTSNRLGAVLRAQQLGLLPRELSERSSLASV